MKKILILFLTFSGICTARAQSPQETIASDSIKKSGPVAVRAERKDSVTSKPAIKLSPNPAVNKVEVEIKGFDPGEVQVQITDMNGAIVKKDTRSVFEGNEIIVLMFSVNPGIYLLSVRQNKKQAKAQLMIR